ncbi:MAG: sterol desaturase family protein [Flavobacteriales bacterium]|nr:sterol desaturase family protein [Flavobacteriales bacterium]
MPVYQHILITLATFLFMEGVAWFTHKYIMHGLLWVLHRDHHQVDHTKILQKNDWFFMIFAVPGASFLMLGINGNFSAFFPVGLGITLYGLTYFLVHEVFIHRRLPFLRNTNSAYFRALRKAHKVHHKHLHKEDGECFGMLWVPLRYFKEARSVLQKS